MEKIKLDAWQYSHQLREDIASGKIPIDLGGHFRNGGLAEINHNLLYLHLDRIPKNGFVAFPPNALFVCPECGEEVELETNGKEVRCLNPCKHPNGVPAAEFELNVPSGKMVVANDLRDGFRVLGDYYINHTINLVKTSLKYASVGLAHGFVGNTCPGVYRRNSAKFTIGAGGRGSRRVAGVCTDLWWYSICDYDEFVRRFKREPDKKYEEIIKCKPGVYQFKHVYHMLDHSDYRKQQIYTYIDWVREPDPLHDFLADFNAQNLTAGQVLLDKVTRFPDVYGVKKKNRKHAIALAAAQHIGHGDTRDYHPNGFLCDNPDLTSNAPDIKVPEFDEPYSDVLDEHSFVCQAAGVGKDILGIMKDNRKIYLNESFTAVAFNILHQVLQYGVYQSESDGEWRQKQKEQSLKWAKKALKGLAKRYPDRVPANCQKFL